MTPKNLSVTRRHCLNAIDWSFVISAVPEKAAGGCQADDSERGVIRRASSAEI